MHFNKNKQACTLTSNVAHDGNIMMIYGCRGHDKTSLSEPNISLPVVVNASFGDHLLFPVDELLTHILYDLNFCSLNFKYSICSKFLLHSVY